MKTFKTAESVRAGHPDKLCDLIAGRILDACLRKDEKSRVELYKRKLIEAEQKGDYLFYGTKADELSPSELEDAYMTMVNFLSDIRTSMYN